MNERILSTTYKVKARAMLPVHIGGGRDHEIDPLEYVIADDGWFYRLDIEGMLASDSAFAAEFVRFMDQKTQNILHLRDLLRKAFKPSDTQHWIHKARASKSFRELYVAKFQDPNNQLLVQCMPLAGRSAYVPGSSIKGALRTVILDGEARRIGYAKVAERSFDRDAGRMAKIVEANLLLGPGRAMPPNEDPFKMLKVSDATLPEDATTVSLVKNWSPKGDKGIEMLVETITPGTEFNFSLQVPAEGTTGPALEFFKVRKIWRSAWDYLVGEPGNLVDEADTHYQGHNNNAEDCIDLIMADADEAKDRKDVTYLRIGRFSHLECITYSDRPKNGLDQTPHLCRMSDWTHKRGWGRTRNLVDGKTPLGVLRLELT